MFAVIHHACLEFDRELDAALLPASCWRTSTRVIYLEAGSIGSYISRHRMAAEHPPESPRFRLRAAAFRRYPSIYPFSSVIPCFPLHDFSF
jgi:hypothetical protein